MSLSDLPYPGEELPTWAECLIPAGFHECLSVALFAREGRHVGFLTVLSESRQPPAPAAQLGQQPVDGVGDRGPGRQAQPGG